MSRKRIVIAAVVIGIIFIISSFYYGAYYQKKNISCNEEDSIRKSIAYLHKDYIDKSKEIEIIDEFNYDKDKVVLFSYYELTGIAKFNRDTGGKLKIQFVETVDSDSIRKVSKVLWD